MELRSVLTRVWSLAWLLLALVGAVPALAAHYQPDAIIAGIGNNLYDNGTRQTAVRSVQVGDAAAYQVTLENDGTVSDSFLLTMPQAGDGWTTSVSCQGEEITSAITSREGWTGPYLLPGKAFQLVVTVTPTRDPRGASLLLTLAATSLGGDTVDTVRALTRGPALPAKTVAPRTTCAGVMGIFGQAPATLRVTPPAGAPVAVNDSYQATRDSLLSVAAPGVLLNDTDASGQSLQASLVSLPAHGVVLLLSGGSFFYTPFPSYTGTDSFTYCASNGMQSSNIATVTITVNALPTTPGGVPCAHDDMAMTCMNYAVSIPVLMNDTDPNHSPLTVSSVGAAAHGTLSVAANGCILYQPNMNYIGNDQFCYQVRNVAGKTAFANVCIDVVPFFTIPPGSLSLTVAPCSPQPTGKELYLEVKSNLRPSVRYRFMARLKAEEKWTELCAYSVSKSLYWTPTRAGEYVLAVWARDVNSTADYDAYATVKYAIYDMGNFPRDVITRVTLDILPNEADYRAHEKLLLRAGTTGGTQAEFLFMVGYQSCGEWQWRILQHYDPNSRLWWAPPGPAQFAFIVFARQVGSGRKYDAFAMQYYDTDVRHQEPKTEED